MIDVDLVHDVEYLVLRGVPPEGAHQHTELLGADEAVAVLQERDIALFKSPESPRLSSTINLVSLP